MPQLPDVDVRVGGTSEKPGPKRRLPGEQVAYVAFHKVVEGSIPPPRPPTKRRELKIHVVAGRLFRVEADATAVANPLGFFGSPLDASDYDQIFFYQHAINAKEDTAPLGELLINAGALDIGKLQRGLEAHEAERHIPIGQVLVDQHVVDPEAVEEAAKLQQRKRLRIGELLVDAGWITPEQLSTALGEQKKRKGKRIGEVLVDLGLVTEEVLCSTLANKFLLPFVNLDQYSIDPAAMREIPKDLIAKYCVLPVKSSQTALTLAIGDPLAVDALEDIRFRIRRRLEEILVIPSQLKRYVLEALQRAETESLESGLDQLLNDIEEAERADAAQAKSDKSEVSESDSTVIRLVNRIIVDAYRRGASDIHVEPYGIEAKTRVRFRIDGECTMYQELPAALRKPVVARIKIMAQLDISERRKPQDGKIRFATKSGNIELRVAILPTVNDNEDVVMRILASSKPLPPESMGYSSKNLTGLTKAVAKPYGLFLVVGPTGSGKTTTLHSILGSLNSTYKKIWTAEDPVEITQAGLRQVQVQPKIGVTFATALRAFLRADPDIIMVGEMRDHETAAIGIEASLTGHLVLSTLHTNSAPETITRLVDMGLDPFSFADALIGILAQRLAKSLCSKCRDMREGTETEYDEMRQAYGPEYFDKDIGIAFGPQFKVGFAPGCDVCHLTGYKGRLGIHELLVANDALRAAIGRRLPIDDLRRLAREAGMTTLLQDGVQKALQGITDMKQVLAVCTK